MKPMERIALEWAVRCFGEDHVHNLPLRSLRAAEEAVELAQSWKVPREKMHLLVDTIYDRPPGNPEQELGGAALTLVVMAAIYRRPLDHFVEQELRRVLAKPAEHFTKRNQEKLDLGLK